MMINIYSETREKRIQQTRCPGVDEGSNFIRNTDGKGEIENQDVYLCELDVQDNIYLKDGQLLIYSCNFEKIQTTTNAAIYLTASKETSKYNIIDNCKFRYCRAPKGAVHVYSQSIFQ